MMKTVLILDERENDTAEAAHSLGLIKEAKTVFAKSVDEALKKCGKNSPDLVIFGIFAGEELASACLERIFKIRPRPMTVLLVHPTEWEMAARLLRQGADDYMTLPMPYDLLRKRIQNYLHIIEARDERQSVANPVNIFDKNIHSKYTCFRIVNEASLAEFWDYFLPRPKKNERLSDCVRILYRIGFLLHTLRYDAQITVEESDDNYYFTIDKVARLNGKILSNIIENNYPTAIYEMIGDRLCFVIPKDPSTILLQKPQTITPKTLQPESKEAPKMYVFDFLDRDDLREIEEYLLEMRPLAAALSTPKASAKSLATLQSVLLRFGRVLSSYQESFKISSSLQTLCFELRSGDIKHEGLASDLEKIVGMLSDWVQSLFYAGAANVDYLSDEIGIEVDTIVAKLKPSSGVAPKEFEGILDI